MGVRGLLKEVFGTKRDFSCKYCNNNIQTNEKCWVNWKLPPSHHKSQTLPRKEFELDNVEMICMRCANKIKDQITEKDLFG
ncbi:hypothetical protein [Gracilibacillus kekensis]|uniref:hypothetical protein n=1 Tax=Gracilibacillus kekensis TaxID=1027249 RepID=UPI000933BDF7|nr:hypothetical protein [Gracilibacillus kekensis]